MASKICSNSKAEFHRAAEQPWEWEPTAWRPAHLGTLGSRCQAQEPWVAPCSSPSSVGCRGK